MKPSKPSPAFVARLCRLTLLCCATFLYALFGAALCARAQVDPNLQLYLLMGQSNMEGMAGTEAQDKVQNARVKVLAYTNCANTGRVYDKWYTAAPPLHGCGAGVGPGDWFGKAMADSFPKATIGLIPTAIAGVDIDYFRKNVVSKRRNEFSIPPDNKRTGAYEMVIEKAKEAQKTGVIRGILFHQGESDAGVQAWVGKVREMAADLRKDLGLGDSVPFLAGELLYGGCCEKHNTIIKQLPGAIPNSFVISAQGLAGQDQAHFNAAAQRELGRRFAARMAPLLKARQTTGMGISGPRDGINASCAVPCAGFALMGLDGRVVAESAERSWVLPEANLPRGLYFIRALGAGSDGRAVKLLLGR
jgi:hypothetical protein